MNPLSNIKTRVYLFLEDFGFSRRLEMKYLTHQMRTHLEPPNLSVGIDIACGLGNLTKIVAETSKARVIGIDYNRRVIDVANVLSSENLAFFTADSHFLPFHEASFDFATSICSFEHFYDDRKALREVWRVLKPGAYFFLTVDSLSHPDVDDDFRCLHTRTCHVCQYYLDQDIRKKLEEANFQVVDSRYLLKGKLASRLAHHGVKTNFGKRYLILSALFYPMILGEESFARGQYGYKLGVTARKVAITG